MYWSHVDLGTEAGSRAIWVASDKGVQELERIDVEPRDEEADAGAAKAVSARRSVKCA
jgi:hypothetical protein